MLKRIALVFLILLILSLAFVLWALYALSIGFGLVVEVPGGGPSGFLVSYLNIVWPIIIFVILAITFTTALYIGKFYKTTIFFAVGIWIVLSAIILLPHLFPH